MLSRLQSPNTLQQRPANSQQQLLPKQFSCLTVTKHAQPRCFAAQASQQLILSTPHSSCLQQQRSVAMASTASPAAAADPQAASTCGKTLICTSITASTVEAFLQEIKEASSTGVDILELRLDFLQDFEPDRDLDKLMGACSLPYIVTYRPKWEG